MSLDPRLKPFQYHLPEELIAIHPPEARDGGRLLVLFGERRLDSLISALPDQLREGDLIVVNNTRVMHARLRARRSTGGRLEIFVLKIVGHRCEVLLRRGRRLMPGARVIIQTKEGVDVDGCEVTLEEKCPDGRWWVLFAEDPFSVMAAVGDVPIPPYLKRPTIPEDCTRYQTPFASVLGAVAAPTAGLHLSENLRAALNDAGLDWAEVTLHVGAGTFLPLSSEFLDEGRLHRESYFLPPETAERILETRSRGGRIIAVGTTTTRCLEAAYSGTSLRPGAGETDLFLRQGSHFQIVDGLLTNFHLPGSSLLMLVCAFGGFERIMAAYRHAVEVQYRFYSYGDAMLILPGGV